VSLTGPVNLFAAQLNGEGFGASEEGGQTSFAFQASASAAMPLQADGPRLRGERHRPGIRGEQRLLPRDDHCPGHRSNSGAGDLRLNAGRARCHRCINPRAGTPRGSGDDLSGAASESRRTPRNGIAHRSSIAV
jgi:hypothetical protein